MSTEQKPKTQDFIRNIIRQDITTNKHNGQVYTRFPPEPNGYLHIGHAKSIALNFGVANEFDGKCNLRFDDTNPDKESDEYMQAIKQDVEWLGYQWAELRHASDYFEQLYDNAVALITLGKAYVCSLSADEIREYRGTLTEPGKDSPNRSRTVEENLQLFARMRNGEFEPGEQVLRAKIDMRSPNMNMRDPTLYRIRRSKHHRTGDQWCIYPMYDYTHCLSDAIEGITHSLCTLEFEDHRPLYDWVLDTLATPCHPQQIEFARLQLKYTLTSKRKLNQLVQDNHVNGWDDPRMPTLSGLRRRGYTPASIRNFCETIGLSKSDSFIDMGVLENSIRDDLNEHAPRAMAVLQPLRVVIENYPGDQTEEIEAQNHPNHPEMGVRTIPFSRVIYIEHDDFMENPPNKFFRLGIGREVRLRYGYYITCRDVIKDDSGEITELRCTYDPKTRGGSSPDGRKVKGTIHWVPASHAIPAEIRLYDRLFTTPNPGSEDNFISYLNPESVSVLQHSMVEPSLVNATSEDRIQFERQGYFCLDAKESHSSKLVFNRIVTLRDSWSKIEKQQA